MSEVLTVLSLLVGTLVTLLSGVKTLGWLVHPWMEKSAKTATDDLYKRLKENDFKHVEDRLDQMDRRMVQMEERLLSAIQNITT